MKLLVINGPNLNLLGHREPALYGTETLQELNDWLVARPELGAAELEFYQSNHEGALIDYLHAKMGHNHTGKARGAVINPGALAHYSYALRDAIEAVDYPVVEVHLSKISQREPFRRISVISEVCLRQITGKGKQGYLAALTILLETG